MSHLIYNRPSESRAIKPGTGTNLKPETQATDDHLIGVAVLDLGVFHGLHVKQVVELTVFLLEPEIKAKRTLPLQGIDGISRGVG
jgi:hypothetical protein